MKTLLEIVVIILVLSTKSFANTNCLKMLKGYIPDDNMVKVAHLTEKTLTLYINNIRNMKDVDITFYGFDDFFAKRMEKKYNCPKTRFIKAYSEYGLPLTVKIKNKYLVDYKNQIIVVGE